MPTSKPNPRRVALLKDWIPVRGAQGRGNCAQELYTDILTPEFIKTRIKKCKVGDRGIAPFKSTHASKLLHEPAESVQTKSSQIT